MQSGVAALETLTRRSAYLGVSLLMLCAVINTADISTRRTVNFSVIGMVDITQLLVMACAFLCIPYTFAREGHIDVDFVVSYLPRRLTAALMSLWNLIAALFMALVTYFAGKAALQTLENGDRSSSIAIPIAWYWLPLLLGCLMSVLVCAALTLRYLRTALTASPALAASPAPVANPAPVAARRHE